MEIVWLGHACFRIRGKEAAVVTDPCDRASTGYSIGKPSADIVTVSKQDPAHAHVAGVGGTPRVLDGPGEYEISGTSVTGVATDHNGAAAAGRNIAFVFELEDLRICHLGAIRAVPTSDQVEEIGAVDLLLIPVGGGEAIDAPPAAETVSLLEPRLVIPMQYRTPVEKTKLDGVDRFLKEMGAKAGEAHAKVAVTRSSLPDETQVMVLNPKS
jgi:L-ascorbate metabolism protein UlaG (beta-lactamase superfamily)